MIGKFGHFSEKISVMTNIFLTMFSHDSSKKENFKNFSTRAKKVKVQSILSSPVGPLLPVRVDKVVDGGRVPGPPQPEEVLGEEPVLGKDDKVREEARGSLQYGKRRS